MAGSFTPFRIFEALGLGPVAGSTPASLLKGPVPARTCGPLGYRDAGDPSLLSFLGDTPGPLGVSDYATPEIVWFAPLKAVNPVPKAASVSRNSKVEEHPITKEQLKIVFPNAKLEYLKQVADELNVDLNKYGIDTVSRKAHFFAQVRKECGPGLQAEVESLNYTPDALQTTFKYYRDHKEESLADGRAVHPIHGGIVRKAAQERIANHAYANRNGNGNAESGDGWNFRGRGLIQVTGRDNYAQVTKQYRKLYADTAVDFERSPELVATFPYSVRCAICFWIMNGLEKKADIGATAADVDRITAIVNYHTDSYKERQQNFTLAYNAFE